MDPAADRDNTIALASHSEDGRLRRVDNCGETVRAPGTKIRDAEGGAFELLELQAALERTVDDVAALTGNLSERQAIDVVDHRHQQAILHGHDETDVRAVRGHDAGVSRAGIAGERRVQRREAEKRTGDSLQQEVVNRIASVPRSAGCR